MSYFVVHQEDGALAARAVAVRESNSGRPSSVQRVLPTDADLAAALARVAERS